MSVTLDEPLLLRGPYRSSTGYGFHTRELARELHRRGAAVELDGLPVAAHELIPHASLEPWLTALPGHTGARHAVHVMIPTMTEPRRGCKNLLYTMFEATRLPAAWLAPTRLHDGLIVPTASSAVVWREAGLPAERIHLCPLGVDTAAFHPGVPPLPLDGVAGRRVRFLHVATAIPRKNLPGLLRVWLRATRADDDAVLVAKISGVGWATQAAFKRAVAAVEGEVGKRFAEAAPIHWLFRPLSDDEMPRLFAAATHYVSLSYGEGWDLPMVQAGASGLRLLAPSHSAYLAYLDERCARLVPAHAVPADAPTGEADVILRQLAAWSEPLFRDAEWWAPDEEAAVARVREALAGAPWPSAPERFAALDWRASVDRLLEIVRSTA